MLLTVKAWRVSAAPQPTVFAFLGEDFDPVLIADKLRSIADSMNDDVMFQAAISGLKQAAANEVGSEFQALQWMSHMNVSGEMNYCGDTKGPTCLFKSF